MPWCVVTSERRWKKNVRIRFAEEGELGLFFNEFVVYLCSFTIQSPVVDTAACVVNGTVSFAQIVVRVP